MELEPVKQSQGVVMHWTQKFFYIAVGLAAIAFIVAAIYWCVSLNSMSSNLDQINIPDLFPTSTPTP